MNAATGEPSGTHGRDGAEPEADARDGLPEPGLGVVPGLGFDGTRDRVAGLGTRPHRDGHADGSDSADAADDGWADDGWAEDADFSQLVRPYTLTRGRTRHAEGAAFDVIAQIAAVDRGGLPDSEAMESAEGPEYQAILDLVLERPLSVAEVAAGTDLPLGVVRILLGDLLDADLIRVSRPVPTAELPDTTVLRDVIRGLRAL